jgi:hypothetical protein
MERPEMAAELEAMAAADLALRQQLMDRGELDGGYHPEMRVVHRRNGDRLTELLDQLGQWPGFHLVGVDGSQAGFIVAQHDIANPSLLRRATELYRAAVGIGDADPENLAAMVDRICYFEGRAQRYGTHVGWDEEGRFGPWPPIEQPETVDQRRRELGLSPLADWLTQARRGRPSIRPSGEVLPEHQAAEQFACQAGWRSAAR